MKAELTVPELVAYALFDLDPRVDDAQRPLYNFLVSLVLLDAHDGLTSTEIHRETVALLPLDGHNISEAEVAAALDLHLTLGLVHRDSEERVYLSKSRRDQLLKARKRLESKKQAFHRHMLDAVSTKVSGLSEEDKQQLSARLENQLVELLQTQSSTVAAAWSSGGQGFDAVLQDLNAREHLSEIANAMAPGGAAPNKLRRAAISLGLEAGLRAIPPDAAAYLGALYHRTVAMALLQQDPTVRRVKSKLAERRIAYLDTNVVLAAMFDADAAHGVASQVLEITRGLNAELRVSPFTVDEISSRIRDASRWMRQYRGPHELREVVDDFIVRSYHRATRDVAGLDWSAFIGGFDPPHPWLKENGIAIDTEDVHDTEADMRVEVVRSVLAQNRHAASAAVIRTDALNIVHVTRKRKNMPADEMGNRVWLVTLDRSLSRGERSLVDDEALPAVVSRLAANWIDLLGPCLPPDEARLSGYVAHLVQSQFSLMAEDPLFIERQFLLTLTRSRFEVAQVLALSTERARQILVRLQESAELTSILGDPQPDDDDWNEQLEEAVRRALEEIDRSPVVQSELDRHLHAQEAAEGRAEKERQARVEAVRALAGAMNDVESVREENTHIREERDALARELEEVTSRSWWRRLFRR